MCVRRNRKVGDAILCAQKHVDGDPCSPFRRYHHPAQHTCTKSLMDVYEKYNASAIAIEKVPDKIERYGIIKGKEVENSVYRIDDMVEKPPLNKAL